MAVSIRLSRFGRLHRPLFRIIAIDKRRHREGVANEILGQYDPLKADKNIEVNLDRVSAWVSKGARISESLKTLLKHSGYQVPTTTKMEKIAKTEKQAEKAPTANKAIGKKGEKQPWVAPTRRALRQHAAKIKADNKIKNAAAAAAKKAAAAPAETAPSAEAPKA